MEIIEFIATKDWEGEYQFWKIEGDIVYIQQELIWVLDLEDYDNNIEQALISLLTLNGYNFLEFIEPFNP